MKIITFMGVGMPASVATMLECMGYAIRNARNYFLLMREIFTIGCATLTCRMNCSMWRISCK